MLTRKSIRDVEDRENYHRARIRSTFAKRDESKRDHQEWSDAATDWYKQNYPTDKLWSPEYLSDLRASNRGSIEEGITYLEVDPWYFRSGYLKERIIRGLKAAKLTESDRKRLWNVVWNAAAGRNRREFRNYCSLAAVVADSDLLELLESVSTERDKASSGKFSYLLNYLRRHAKH